MKTKLFYFFAILGFIFCIIVSFHNVLSGSIAFWYDPARDMLSAWENLSKLTLIGPPSGIPGIFYGPYWIWWLSLGELISPDPQLVVLITTTLPYIIFYSLLWYLFSKIFGKLPALLVWLLYFYAFQGQITSLWNPNLAPLLFLGIIYFLTVYSLQKKELIKVFFLFVAGIFSGIVLNIHISFSVGFIVGSVIYLFLFSVFNKEKNAKKIIATVKYIGIYLSGFLVTIAPFFLFEIRHGFSQSKTLLYALSKGGAVVQQHGLTKIEILQNFINRLGLLLQIPFPVTVVVFITILVLFLILFLKKKVKLQKTETRLVSLIGLIALAVLTVFLTAKNPVWPYHFIGAEIIFSFLIALFISKIKVLQYALLIWIIILSIIQIQQFIIGWGTNPLLTSSLYTKEVITKTIIRDAKNKPYTFFAYNPAIYMYDYAYLFRWLDNKNESYDPGQVNRQGTIYLILSPGKKEALEDFTHFRSPDNLYTTKKTWHFPDGTIILRRSLKTTS